MHWFCGIDASKDTQNLNIKRTFSFALFTHIIKVLENFQILKSWSHFTRTANSRTKCSEDTKVTTWYHTTSYMVKYMHRITNKFMSISTRDLLFSTLSCLLVKMFAFKT